MTEDELDETSMSFQEWSDAGFFIKKGSKSRLRDPLGVPQFQIDQVVPKQPKEPCRETGEDTDEYDWYRYNGLND